MEVETVADTTEKIDYMETNHMYKIKYIYIFLNFETSKAEMDLITVFYFNG